MTDCLIIGCGFSGAAAARKLAETGKRVLVLEKRPHISGNMYDCPDSNGVLVHRYGPHIFHTSNRPVFDFLLRFSAFFPYEHHVLGHIDGKLVPIPFNFRSIDTLFEGKEAQTVKELFAEAFPEKSRASVYELMENEREPVRRVGKFVYEKVFQNYTAKQWGTAPEKVDRSVLGRVPVKLGYDGRYFDDTFQFMPVGGYTPLFEKMLSHPLISVELGCDALARLKLNPEDGTITLDGEPFNHPVLYTGPIDELFGCRFGRLPYRSLDLVFEQVPKTTYQPAAVVNYPNEEAFTRITEFKYLTGQRIEGSTTILREYPLDYDRDADRGNIPYYPVANEHSSALYSQYQKTAALFSNLYLCGRLAEYRYYNMDAAIDAALKRADEMKF